MILISLAVRVVYHSCICFTDVCKIPDQRVILWIEGFIECCLLFPVHLCRLSMSILLHIVHSLTDLPDPLEVLPQLLSAFLRTKLITLNKSLIHSGLQFLFPLEMPLV